MTKNSNQEKRAKVMTVNMMVVFVIVALAAFCVDGFLLHPIPSQGYGSTFRMTEADTPYANATILEARHENSAENDVFMVEQDGEIHMLYFARHGITDRHALKDDVIVEPDFTGNVRVGTTRNQVTLIMENGKIVNRSEVSYGSNRALGGYLGIGVLVTAVESVLLWQFLKKKYPVG